MEPMENLAATEPMENLATTLGPFQQEVPEGKPESLLFVPLHLRLQILEMFHSHKNVGHPVFMTAYLTADEIPEGVNCYYSSELYQLSERSNLGSDNCCFNNAKSGATQRAVLIEKPCLKNVLSELDCVGKKWNLIGFKPGDPDKGYQNLRRYLQTVRFSSGNVSREYFNDDQEFDTSYIIQNHVLANGTLFTREVGFFGNQNSNSEQVFINESLIKWKNDQKKIPRSQCSDTCFPGYRKVQIMTIFKCCFGCVPCAEGEISNVTGSENCMKCLDHEWSNENKTQCNVKSVEYLSFTNDNISLFFITFSVCFFILTVVIIVIFILNENTPIVKANNKNLSFVLLVSLMISFLCVFLFLGHPVDITCSLRKISFGTLFTIAVSSMLAKTITVFIAFKAIKPGSSWSRWMGAKLPNSIVFICSSGQVVICIIWLSISPPFQELDTTSYHTKIIAQCNEGMVIGLYLVLSYMGILAALSFIIAFFARTLPDSFNEAKYITFSMLVFFSVWIAVIPAYVSARGKNVVAVEIFAILTSSAGLLVCIFFPKCYIMFFRPELITKKNFLGSRHN
ncbi:vomeronasal type-2 receptor 116-like [Hyperolius riggenbachi]|uniref:vomeronasal type-2 receptor 116-like n=1 Tax=Hyperolius riggenbachi TaxID=752182 RepID=UPI0035A31D92